MSKEDELRSNFDFTKLKGYKKPTANVFKEGKLKLTATLQEPKEVEEDDKHLPDIAIEEFYHIVHKHKKRLIRQVISNVWAYCRVGISANEATDLISDAMLETAEKYSTLSFKSTNKIINYLSMFITRKFKDDARKDRVAKKKWYPELFLEEYYISEDDALEREVSIAAVYSTFIKYIEEKFNYETAGIYKCYVFNDNMSYAKLAAETGYSASKVGNIIKMVKKDLAQNREQIMLKSFINR